MGDTKKAAPRRRWTRAKEDAFFEHLQSTGNVAGAASVAGVSRSMAYERRREDAVFAARWQGVLDSWLDNMEAALMQKALGHLDGPAVDDRVALYLLKIHRPELYDLAWKVRRETDGLLQGPSCGDSPRAAIAEQLDSMQERLKPDGTTQ